MESIGKKYKQSNYSAQDNHPISGISYYRLKQTDFDGEFTYSKIQGIQIQLSNIQYLEIFPNPTNSSITINGNSDELEEVLVYNSLGQNVSPLTQIISKTESNLVLDLSNLNSGIYYIKTKNTSNKVTKL